MRHLCLHQKSEIMKPQTALKPGNFLLAFLIILFSFFISCKNQDKKREFSEINFTPDQFIEKENVLLDTIVDKIEYVMLETSPDSYIGRISSLFITEDEILLISQGDIFIFDRTGRFKTKLGAEGRGPEEYLSPLEVLYNSERDRYVIYDSKSVLEFDANYNFIKKTEHDRNLKRIKPLGNDKYVGELMTESFYGDSVVYSLVFYDREMNIISKLETTESTEPVKGQQFMIDLMGGLNHGSDGVLFMEQYGDTIYNITPDMERVPLLRLDMGDKKYPKELNFNMALFQEKRNDYIQPGKFSVIDGTLIMQFLFDGKSMYSWTDISSDKTIIPVIEEGDKEYGFMLKAFPGYGLKTYFTDGYIFEIIQPSDVMEYFDKEAESIPADLKTVLENITVDQNPVLILGRY